jgi:hypothetical protein
MASPAFGRRAFIVLGVIMRCGQALSAVVPKVDIVSEINNIPGIACHTTYRLSIELDPTEAHSVHSIFGSTQNPMVLPPAFQVASPYGADVGGVSPLLFASSPVSEFDSWLTIGDVSGSTGTTSHLANGIDFGAWTAQAGLTVDSGILTFMDAATSGRTSAGPVLIAQLTLPSGLQTVRMSFAGHAEERSGSITAGLQKPDWRQEGVLFELMNNHPPLCLQEVVPIVKKINVDASCRTTYRLSIIPPDGMHGVHSIFGSAQSPLVLPPAAQVAGPYGADVGGVSPELVAARPEAEFDSWITVGETAGLPSSGVLSGGLDLSAWSTSSGFECTSCILAVMSNRVREDVVVAQLTLEHGVASTVRMNFQVHQGFWRLYSGFVIHIE